MTYELTDTVKAFCRANGASETDKNLSELLYEALTTDERYYPDFRKGNAAQSPVPDSDA